MYSSGVMRLFGYLIVNTAALLITAYLVPGFVVENFQTALVAAVVIGFINTFIKPILRLITLPITIVSLGLFALILNVLLLYFAAAITPGFELDGIMTAFLGSIVLSITSSFLSHLTK